MFSKTVFNLTLFRHNTSVSSSVFSESSRTKKIKKINKYHRLDGAPGNLQNTSVNKLTSASRSTTMIILFAKHRFAVFDVRTRVIFWHTTVSRSKTNRNRKTRVNRRESPFFLFVKTLLQIADRSWSRAAKRLFNVFVDEHRKPEIS